MFSEGHLRSSEGLASSFLRCLVISGLCKGLIQTEARVIPSYHGNANPMAETEKAIDTN